jgi:DNA-binding FadR family transcriptional regulator
MTRARAVIESAMVMEVVRVCTARDLLGLHAAIEQMESIPLAASNQEMERADELFHLELLKATHNPVMQTFGQLIVQQFRQKVKKNLKVIPSVVKRAIEGHRLIVSAVENRDANAARETMYDHVISQLQELARNKKTKSGKWVKK